MSRCFRPYWTCDKLLYVFIDDLSPYQLQWLYSWQCIMDYNIISIHCLQFNQSWKIVIACSKSHEKPLCLNDTSIIFLFVFKFNKSINILILFFYILEISIGISLETHIWLKWHFIYFPYCVRIPELYSVWKAAAVSIYEEEPVSGFRKVLKVQAMNKHLNIPKLWRSIVRFICP